MGSQWHRRRLWRTRGEQLVRRDPGSGTDGKPRGRRAARSAVGKGLQPPHRHQRGARRDPGRGARQDVRVQLEPWRSTKRPSARVRRRMACASSSMRSTRSPGFRSSRSPRPAMPTSSTKALRPATRCDCSSCRTERRTSITVSPARPPHPAARSWWMASPPTARPWSTSTSTTRYSEAANGTIGFDYRLDVPSLDLDLVYLIGVTQISTPGGPGRHRCHACRARMATSASTAT